MDGDLADGPVWLVAGTDPSVRSGQVLDVRLLGVVLAQDEDPVGQRGVVCGHVAGWCYKVP